MRQTADVVVIGAGIQGLSAAYHIAKSGIAEVVVVEAEFIGAGSSGRSASMLMRQRDGRDKIALAQHSFRRYMEFEQEMGTSIGLRRIGYLSIVPAERREAALQQARLRQAMGVRTEILDPPQVKELVPAVNVDDIALGVFGPDDGVIDAHAIMLGYAAAARRLGVSIEQGIAATGIALEGRNIRAVRTTAGEIATERVVNAGGASATEIGNWIGVSLPLTNAVRSIFVTTACPQIPVGTPMVEDAGLEWYFRKDGDAVLIGMGRDTAGVVSNKPNWSFLPAVAAVAAHRVPVLANAQIAGGWSGVRSLTEDRMPILGACSEFPGFIADCGWGGEGVMLAPAGGQIVADILNGNPDATHPIGALSPDRFASR